MRGKILQRYLLSELASPTLLGLIVFTFVLLATHLFRLVDLLINRGVPMTLFLQFVGTLVPPLLILTAPMALLVGVLLGVGRLAADSEIMAMRTSGVHLMTVFTPVLFAAMLLASGLWLANRSWVPGLIEFNADLLDKIKVIVASTLEAGRVFRPSSDADVALYFHHRNPLTQRMEGITLKVIAGGVQTRNAQSELVATSREGRINANVLDGWMEIILNDGTLHHFDTATTVTDVRYYVARYDELHWRLTLTKKDKNKPGKPARKAREMTNHEITKTLQEPALNVDDRGSLTAEVQQRRSIPLACVAFVLLGVPLAIRVRPTGKAVAFSIAFGLIFFYYIMLKWGVSLCQNSSALGVVVIFLPNIVVGGVGTVLFVRILRQ